MASINLSVLHELLCPRLSPVSSLSLSLSIYILVYMHVVSDAAIGLLVGAIAVQDADLHAKLLSTNLLHTHGH